MKSLAFCVVACLSASLLLAQGLGGAARKEEERRKKSAQAGTKVRTVDDAALVSATEGKGTLSVADENEAASAPSSVTSSSPGSSGYSPVPAAGSATSSTSSTREKSDLDRLNEKSEYWRGRYRQAKEKADRLEREVADLEAKDKRIGMIGTTPGKPIRDRFGNIIAYEDRGGSSPYRTEAEIVRERLPRARQELARAKQELSDVEDGARRAGVASGQLYQ